MSSVDLESAAYLPDRQTKGATCYASDRLPEKHGRCCFRSVSVGPCQRGQRGCATGCERKSCLSLAINAHSSRA
jgi:hypothetical protein